MRGHIRQRGRTFSIVFDVQQTCRRCVICNRPHWGQQVRRDSCVSCGGALRDAHEERRRTWRGGFRNKTAATDALNQILGKVVEGGYVPPSTATLRDFVEQEWLPSMRDRVRASTWESYARNMRVHILPVLGAERLRSLQPGRIAAFYAALAEPADGRRPLADQTRHYVAMITKRALNDATRWGRLGTNPAARVDPPKVRNRPTMRTWTGDQLRGFLDHVRDDRLYAAWLLTSTTGMRRGEVLGLRWSDVDLDAGRLSIVQSLVSTGEGVRIEEPKTKRGRRSVSLDAATVAALRDHRKGQLTERMRWGPAYEDSGLVFTRENGKPVDPWAFSASFRAQSRAAGLPPIRLHDLRHTWATIALQAGVHPKVVSERLGHANISITLDTYSHVIPAMQEEAAQQVAALILGV